MMLDQCLGDSKVYQHTSETYIATHCMNYRGFVAFKEMSPSLNIVLNFVVTAIIYLKTRSLQSRGFPALSKDENTLHSTLLF